MEKNTSSASTENEEVLVICIIVEYIFKFKQAINYVEENNPSLIIASRPIENNPRLYLDRLPKGARNLDESSSSNISAANPNFDTSSEEISQPLDLNLGSSSKPPLDKMKSLPTYEENMDSDLIFKNRSFREINKKKSLDVSELTGSPLLSEYSKKENVAEPTTEEIPKIGSKNKGNVEQTISKPLAHEIPTHEIKNNDKNKKHVNESSSSNSTVRNQIDRFENLFHRGLFVPFLNHFLLKAERNESSDESDQETNINANGWITRANNGNQLMTRETRPLVLPPRMHAEQILKRNGGSSSNGPNNGESVLSPKVYFNMYIRILDLNILSYSQREPTFLKRSSQMRIEFFGSWM
ncbi:unnamed protein product [Meloidogyne enterolobii]|uniref:Uncharacterized protein n=1 Tax=Meloidogyne enterolobii TaxID=390850 RepID=A0ACB1B6Q4_MELEN